MRQMVTIDDIRDVGVKLRKVYYKCYQRALELSCSTFYLEFIDSFDYHNLMTELGNEHENMMR